MPKYGAPGGDHGRKSSKRKSRSNHKGHGKAFGIQGKYGREPWVIVVYSVTRFDL